MFQNQDVSKTHLPFEPRRKKICLWGVRPGPTQTKLYNNRRWILDLGRSRLDSNNAKGFGVIIDLSDIQNMQA